MSVEAGPSLSNRAIFSAALELAEPAARQAYLDEVCGGDVQRRAQIEQLMAAHEIAQTNPLDKVVDQLGPENTLESEPSSVKRWDWSSPPTIDRYKIREQIGEGGMGVVYVAEQTSPVRRKVALKIIKPGMNSKDVIARFEAERQALALMNHPHIAKVLDAGATEAGSPYFVMELVKGIPITNFCDQHTLDLRQRLDLFLKVCGAVQHAHQKGLIHRDLKPSNILVELEDVRAVPKVIDFGVAKATHQALTERSLYTGIAQMIGTPLYMSPEQAQLNSLDVDTRSDIYSLGVLLYELLTGGTPFDGDSLKQAGFDEMRRIIREVEPPRPSSRISTLGAAPLSTVCEQRHIDPRKLSSMLRGELDWIVMKALEKDRNRRYETASALAADIQRYLNDESVQACPPSAAYRFRKFARRNKAKFATVTMVIAALIVGVVVSLWQAVRATHAQANADLNAARATNEARQAQTEREKAQEEQRKAQLARDSEQTARLAETKERERAVGNEQKALANEKRANAQMYYADLRLGLVDWTVGNIARLENSLLRHVPQPGTEDPRSWEWYYLLGLTHEDIRTIRHSGTITSVAWRPDGRYLASTGEEGIVRVYDCSTWQVVRTWSGPSGYAASWSPDGERLAFGLYGGCIRLVRFDDNQEAMDLPGHSPRGVTSTDWSPDGKHLATAGRDQTIRIWDTSTGLSEAVANLRVQSVAWHPNGTVIAAREPFGRTIILDAKNLAILASNEDILATHTGALDWSPDGSTLAVDAMQRHQLFLLRGDDLSVKSQWDALSFPTNSLAWSPDGTQLAAAGFDQVVHIFDQATGECVESLRGHLNQVKSLAWEPNGQRLVSGGMDGQLKVWSLPRAVQPRRLEKHTGAINALAWRKDGKELRSLCSGIVAFWNVESGECMNRVSVPHGRGGQFSSDGKLVVIDARVGNKPHVDVCVTESGELLQSIESSAIRDSDYVPEVFSRDASKLVITEDSAFRVLNLSNRDTVFSWKGIWVAGVSWSPDGRYLAVAGSGQGDGGHAYIHVFDTNEKKRTFIAQHGTSEVWASAVLWDPSGQKLLSSDQNGLLEFRDLTTGHKFATANLHNSEARVLSWCPIGPRVASGGRDGCVCVWDPTNGQELLKFEVAGSDILQLAWSPDGQRLAAGTADGTVHIWDASRGYDFARSDEFACTILRRRLEYARERWDAGETDEAKRLFVEAIRTREKNPQDFPPWVTSMAHAFVARVIEKNEDATSLIDLARELTPQDPTAVNRAIARQRKQ